MVGAARDPRETDQAEAVARVVYSPAALDDLERLFDILLVADPHAATAAARAIQSAVGVLADHPLIGRAVGRELRELVISFGRTGFVALYRFVPVKDEVRVLALRHQRELDYPE